MASLETKVCKRLAPLIALCLLFSFIPIAGSKFDPKDAKEYVNIGNMCSIPAADSVVAPQISARKFVSGAMAENAIYFEAKTSSLGDTQGQSTRKLLQTFSKPELQDELSEIDAEDMSAIEKIHGVGLSDVNGAANTDREAGASTLVDTIRPVREEYHMKTLKKGQVLGSQRYIKVKRFQLIEAIERETHHKKDLNVVSHGLIRVKPIELIKAGEEEVYPQDHQRRALALQWRTGMLWVKTDANKATEQRLSKLSSSHFGSGLGLSREQEQIHNVVAALRRSGLFAAIAGTIEGMNLFMLPQMTTIFVPTDSAYQALKQEDINFELFQYHTVIQLYAFSQLCRLREGDVLYTALPGYSIIVTGEPSPFKISLDGVSVIAADIYVDQSIAVHGIDGIFNCTMYGKKFGDWHVPEAAPPPANVSDKKGPPSISPPVQGPDPSSVNGSVAGAAAGGSNASVSGSGEAGQHAPAQQNGGTIPTPTTSGDPNTFPFSFSPLASELASDTDASQDTISAKIGACAAATASFCLSLILCFL